MVPRCILVCEESGEMLANDIVVRKALDAFTAGTPGQDVAFAI